MTRGIARRRSYGFTIVEAMVTLALFGLCALTICNLIDVAMKGVTRQHAQDSMLRSVKSSIGHLACELREANEIQLPYSGSAGEVQLTRHNPQNDPADPNSPKILTVRYYLDGNGPTYALVREAWTDSNQKGSMVIAGGIESLNISNDPVNKAVTVSLEIHSNAGTRNETIIVQNRTL